MRIIKLFCCYILTHVGLSSDPQTTIINISGPITIQNVNFTVNGGQLNSQDPETALDGLERPLQKAFYGYLYRRYQREQMRSSARDEPS